MLHNLHLPFSGTILASFSVVLMIAFLQVWNVHGLIWRAGIICGLMKSLSPSAVILGPMTGIMMEAMIMDLLIYLVGRNMIGYLLAGVGALLSTILHKLANLFILYGADLVTIYVNLFHFLKKQLNLDQATPQGLILGIISVYMVLGAVAAATGYGLGSRSLRNNTKKGPLPVILDHTENTWALTAPDRPFHLALFILHLLMIPGLLLLINRYGLSSPSLIPAGIYLSFLLYYYKRIWGRLKKPFFWGQLLIMTLFAVLFWKPSEAIQFSWTGGFLVGLEMSVRAILIVSSFSALSVEIRNPRITESLLTHGFGNAYAALSLAFNSLPAMLDQSSDLKSFLRKPLQSFSNMLSDAEGWLQCYQTGFRK
jgi:hypothetical protein